VPRPWLKTYEMRHRTARPGGSCDNESATRLWCCSGR
jgi:hypothetical protein